MAVNATANPDIIVSSSNNIPSSTDVISGDRVGNQTANDGQASGAAISQEKNDAIPSTSTQSTSQPAGKVGYPEEGKQWGSNFWVTLVDPRTQVSFFACPATGQVSWDPPVGNFVLPPSAEGEWWELTSAEYDGLSYYYHTKTGETVWERPDGFIIPLNVLQNTALAKRLSTSSTTIPNANSQNVPVALERTPSSVSTKTYNSTSTVNGRPSIRKSHTTTTGAMTTSIESSPGINGKHPTRHHHQQLSIGGRPGPDLFTIPGSRPGTDVSDDASVKLDPGSGGSGERGRANGRGAGNGARNGVSLEPDANTNGKQGHSTSFSPTASSPSHLARSKSTATLAMRQNSVPAQPPDSYGHPQRSHHSKQGNGYHRGAATYGYNFGNGYRHSPPPSLDAAAAMFASEARAQQQRAHHPSAPSSPINTSTPRSRTTVGPAAGMNGNGNSPYGPGSPRANRSQPDLKLNLRPGTGGVDDLHAHAGMTGHPARRSTDGRASEKASLGGVSSKVRALRSLTIGSAGASEDREREVGKTREHDAMPKLEGKAVSLRGKEVKIGRPVLRNPSPSKPDGRIDSPNKLSPTNMKSNGPILLPSFSQSHPPTPRTPRTPQTPKPPGTPINEFGSFVGRSDVRMLGDRRSIPHDLASDIQQFAESEFAKRYFSTHRKGFIFRRRVPVEQMMSWSKALLTSPLLQLARPLHKDAMRTFKVIQLLMGDREPERRGAEALNRSTSSKASFTSSMTATSVKALLEEERWLLSQGILHGELRDEIFCQLIKQLNGCPSLENIFKGWQLLCVLLITFPPSKNFEDYLRSFIQQHTTYKEGRVDVMAKYALNRLLVISRKGPRGKPPTLAEIESASDAPFNPSTFGEPLDAIYRLQTRTAYAHFKIPIVLPFLADGILALGGMQSEGIFRIPGDGDTIGELKARIDRGFYTVDGIDDPNVLAGLMKLWLRELQDPLIPDELYNECVESAARLQATSSSASSPGGYHARTGSGSGSALGPASMSEVDKEKEKLKERDRIREKEEACLSIVGRLPTINRRVVLFVVSFLQLFLDEKVMQATKMTAVNLALIMAPNLLRCRSESMAVVFTNAQYEQIFVHNLLLHLKCDLVDPNYIPEHGMGAITKSSGRTLG